MFIVAFQASNGYLLFGALPESATILLFGTCLIISTMGIRKFLNRQDETNVVEEEENFKGQGK